MDRSAGDGVRSCTLAMPNEQFGTVTSVLAPPASFLKLHEDGRLPFAPDLLQLTVEQGRFGSPDDFGFLGLQRLRRRRRQRHRLVAIRHRSRE